MSKRLLIVLVIFAVDAFAAFVWLFYTETPGYVLGEMRRRMAATTAVRIVVDAAGEGHATLPSLVGELGGAVGASQDQGAFTLHDTAELDLRDLGAPRRDDTFRLTFTSSSTPPSSYAGELRAIGPDRYLRLDDLPGSDPFSVSLRGEWAELAPASLDLPLLRAPEAAAVDDATAIKLRGLFRSSKLFTFRQELPEATLQGARHYRYVVDWRPDAALATAILAAGIRDKAQLPDAEISRLSAELSRASFSDVELLVRKRDFFLSAIVIEGTYRDLDSGDEVAFSATVSLSPEDAPQDIEAPTPSRPIADYLRLAGASGLTLSSGRSGAVEATPESSGIASVTPSPESGAASEALPYAAEDDPDGDGLSDTLEAFYRTDPLNPDTDGDGYGDGYEVDNGYDPTGPGQLFRFGQ